MVESRDIRSDATSRSCVFCMNKPGITREHIPGKAFFLAGEKRNLITVPSCERCRSAIQKDEDYTRALVTMTQDAASGPGRIHWDRKTRYSLRKDLGLRAAFARGIEPVNLVTRGGLFVGRGTGMRVDWPRVERFIDKCVRGLFYFEFGETLPRTAVITRYYANEQPEVLETVVQSTSHGKMRWPDIFDYRRARDEQDPYSSLWALRFYRGASFVACTELADSEKVPATAAGS